METRKQGAAVHRASKIIRIGNVDEFDRSASIQPAHHRDFAPAQRTGTIMPDDQTITLPSQRKFAHLA